MGSQFPVGADIHRTGAFPGTQVRAIRSYVWDIILTIRSIEYFYIGFRSRRLPMRDQCAGTFGPCPNCYYERCGHLGAGALRRR